VLPILFAGLLAGLLVLERILTFRREAYDGPLGRQAIELVSRGELSAARKLVERAGTPAARVLHAGLAAFERGFEARAAALGEAILAETPRVERSLTILGMLAAIAPLLGLLGTVSGMIAMFQVLSAHGTGNPKLLSGGISEALITTQLGLLVAVPVLFAHALLVRRAERTLTRIEEQATALASMHAQPAQAASGGGHD
jgi:biopolymer transport protein ExbB